MIRILKLIQVVSLSQTKNVSKGDPARTATTSPDNSCSTNLSAWSIVRQVINNIFKLN